MSSRAKPKIAARKKTGGGRSSNRSKKPKPKKKDPVAEAQSVLPDPTNTPFSTIPEALDDLAKGRMIILVDDEDRENEGDLVMAGEKITAEDAAFIMKKASGEFCLALSEEICDRLNLSLQTSENASPRGTAFTVTIEARRGVTTGISAADRAHTIRTASSAKCRPEDLARPGHVHPLRARDGGVLVRAGHTEGGVDLCRLAGLQPAAIICEIINDDGKGTLARLSQLELFAAEHNLKIVSIEDLIEYRRATEKLVERVVDVKMPTKYGDFRCHVYQCPFRRENHLAITMGKLDSRAANKNGVLVRVHSECLTGDAFGSLRCDCGDQLDTALQAVADEGRGVVVYMRQEGRGIGLVNKLRAYGLQDRGVDTVEANRQLGFKPDLRRYGLGAQILYDLGVRKMRLLTNNPRKIVGLDSFGLEVLGVVPLRLPARPQNRRYLKAKKEKMAHFLDDM